MSISDEKRKACSTPTRFANRDGAIARHLRSIVMCEPSISIELGTMVCWHSLATGNLAAAQTLSGILLEMSVHDTSA